ncbi:TrmH family RNA methyltransferase [Alteromonas sp. KUL42]|uniref:RNA methyltransferase n=1 Tax=Alteromonas sp. KUL42 TaxID=2480797 RepID=UPI000792C7C7|nr:RNA methyltransferase [Alteromonas sp. KUL42]KXJ61856.1 MAG: RNA methyltransferase [Alteromonas sp. Nap_26]TAP36581.1 TrmH family RNA methyltransferase [Alteromonas sp. KUL42]
MELTKQKVSIGLVNPKNPVNVASILRAAGCYGVASVFYTGQRYRFAKDFNADTKAFHKTIPTIGVDDLKETIPVGASVVAVELVEGAIPLPAFEHPSNAYYIFGPEDGSVSSDVLAWCDHVVYVPTYSCMNLAATANVLLYDRLAKSHYEFGDALIRESRDTNNRTTLLR